jgi:adenine/guanine phosphoribosyltransferase-like PRPP-binding protein
VTSTTYTATIGSQHVELPLIPLSDTFAIALLMTIDHGLRFLSTSGAELAALVADTAPDIVAAPATLGIPVALEVTRALGLDDFLVLQKTPKVHMDDAYAEALTSITTDRPQTLLLDRARAHAVAGRRVVLVDDVVSTGSSIAAALRLLRVAGADVVAVGALLTEGSGWKAALGADAGLVRTLGSIPVFDAADGGWAPRWT